MNITIQHSPSSHTTTQLTTKWQDMPERTQYYMSKKTLRTHQPIIQRGVRPTTPAKIRNQYITFLKPQQKEIHEACINI